MMMCGDMRVGTKLGNAGGTVWQCMEHSLASTVYRAERTTKAGQLSQIGIPSRVESEHVTLLNILPLVHLSPQGAIALWTACRASSISYTMLRFEILQHKSKNVMARPEKDRRPPVD